MNTGVIIAAIVLGVIPKQHLVRRIVQAVGVGIIIYFADNIDIF